MAVSEERRRELYQSLEAAHGPRVAATMMEYLPPVGWSDVARQGDLVLLRSDVEDLRAEFQVMRGDLQVMRGDLQVMRGDLQVMRGDLDGLRRDLDTGLAAVRAEIRSEAVRLEHRMDGGFDRLRAEMHDGFGAVRTDFAAIIAAQTRSMVLMVLGSILTVAVIAFTAAASAP